MESGARGLARISRAGASCLALRGRAISESLKTFEEKFCAAERCSAEEFPRRVFWKCLHRHAVPLAAVLIVIRPNYFAIDRELIGEIRSAQRMHDVWEEIQEYFVSPRYQGWLRKRANVRISAKRLIALARRHLPSSAGPGPQAGAGPD